MTDTGEKAGRQCAWCRATVPDIEGGVLPWDGTGYWPDRELPYCTQEHRAALIEFSVFSRKQYRFAQMVLWAGVGVYLLAMLALPQYRAMLTALAALDLGLSFYLYPFAPPFVQVQLGVKKGISLMRVLALTIIGGGTMVFFRAMLVE